MGIEEYLKENFASMNVDQMLGFLFTHFYGMFPSTHSILKTEEWVSCSKFSWEMAFMIAGIIKPGGYIDVDLLYRGFSLLGQLNQKFMPSCGQFIDLCINGLPKNKIEE